MALALLMLLPSAAGAQSVDPSNPSVDQYVESVPSAGGGSGGGPNATGGHPQRADVSRAVHRQIRKHGGSDAKQLRAIVSSPDLGAPVDQSGTAGSTAGSTAGGAGGGGSDSGGRSGTGGGSSESSGGEPSRPSALSAAVGAGSHGDGTAYGWLIAGILLLSAAMAVAVLARRRRTYPRFR